MSTPPPLPSDVGRISFSISFVFKKSFVNSLRRLQQIEEQLEREPVGGSSGTHSLHSKGKEGMHAALALQQHKLDSESK